MKTSNLTTILLVFLVLGIWLITFVPSVMAGEIIKYNCSNQVYSAFSKKYIEAFIQDTGVQVDVKTASSGSCLFNLGKGFCDIASTTRKLYRRHEVYGYKEYAFCKDPIAVIAKKGCGVDNLTEGQLQDLFAGEIKNWKQVGGADLPVMIIVPGKNTAAHKNFRRHVMKYKDIQSDFMAWDSTMVIEAVKYFPCGAVSFVSRGASIQHDEMKTISINGMSPQDKEYPYHQIFYYITRGEPSGSLKAFIDYTYSDAGSGIIKTHGMIPITQ